MEPVSSVSREAVKSFAAALGFDPVDVRSIEIGANTVTVTTYRRDADGRPIADGPRVAVAITDIPIN